MATRGIRDVTPESQISGIIAKPRPHIREAVWRVLLIASMVGVDAQLIAEDGATVVIGHKMAIDRKLG